MKKITVDFPIVGWASTTIEVEDDYDVANLRDDVEDGLFEIPWNGETMSLFPVVDLTDFVRNGGDGEMPLEVSAS